MKTYKTRKPVLTLENKIHVLKTNTVAITIVIWISLTASSVIFGQVNKGYAPVNGVRLYYEIYGIGEIPLVLIHGGGSTIDYGFDLQN